MADTWIAEPNEAAADAAARWATRHRVQLGAQIAPNTNAPPLDGVLFRFRWERRYTGGRVATVKTVARIRWRRPFTMGLPIATGTTPPALQVYGEPLGANTYPIGPDGYRELRLRVVLGGTALEWSADLGKTWRPADEPEPITPAMNVEGVELRFSAGTFTDGDAYTIPVFPPFTDEYSLTPTSVPVAP